MKKRGSRNTRRAKISQGKQPSAPVSESRRTQAIFFGGLTGALFIAVMVLLKLAVEHTAFGKQMELAGYNLLQLQLSHKDIPITVVDISDWKPAIANGYEVTSREELQKLVEAIANQKPRAIGIDIDFSPEDNDYVTPFDPKFFEFCKTIRERMGVPVFLGIHRTQASPPERWLGSEDYKELAAAVAMPEKGNRRAPLWIKPEGSSEEGPTMSLALAHAFRNAEGPLEHGPLTLPHWMVEPVSEESFSSGGTAAEFLIDFSPLEDLQTPSNTLRVPIPSIISSQGELFRDKVILVGEATLNKTSDTFIAPGREELTPRIFQFACGVYTLIQGPLYELTGWGRVFIDVMLSGIVLIIVSSIRWYYKDRSERKVATHKLQKVLTFVVGLAALICGVLFVRAHRVMWDDFILVVVALLLHSSVERYSEILWGWAKRGTTQAYNKLIFEEEGGKHK